MLLSTYKCNKNLILRSSRLWDKLDYLSNLTGLQQTLASEWEGQAFQGFDRQFNELKPKVREFAELLEQINLQLVSAARAMEEHDQALSQKFGLN